MKNFYWFCYYAPDYELRAKAYPFHKVRDALALLELSAALGPLGYSYKEPLLNYPSEDRSVAVDDSTSWRDKDDLIVLTTRPPINDEDEEVRALVDQEEFSRKGRGVRTVSRSHTSLEDELFNKLKPFITWCSRSQVKLAPAVCQHLQDLSWKKWQRGRAVDIGRKANRWNTEFSLNAGAAARSFNMESSDLKTTLGYLWHSPAKMPRLLSVWGMGGRESLIWARILRTTCQDVLRTAVESPGERFVIGEFPAVEPFFQPTGLEFVEDLKVETVEGVVGQ